MRSRSSEARLTVASACFLDLTDVLHPGSLEQECQLRLGQVDGRLGLPELDRQRCTVYNGQPVTGLDSGAFLDENIFYLPACFSCHSDLDRLHNPRSDNEPAIFMLSTTLEQQRYNHRRSADEEHRPCTLLTHPGLLSTSGGCRTRS
jgi:hypothetical protein